MAKRFSRQSAFAASVDFETADDGGLSIPIRLHDHHFTLGNADARQGVDDDAMRDKQDLAVAIEPRQIGFQSFDLALAVLVPADEIAQRRDRKSVV